MAFYSRGNNSQNALKSFRNRKAYDTRVMPIPLEAPHNYILSPHIDLTVDKPFYGRIDDKSDSVFTGKKIGKSPSSRINDVDFQENSFIKKFSNTPKNLFAMNFVVDAFEDMADYFNKSCNILTNLSREGPYSNLAPVVGWSSPTFEFDQFIYKLYYVFRDKFVENIDSNKIKNFNDFTKILTKYMINYDENSSIVFSDFILSRYASPNISGLVVEVAVDDFTDDLVKCRKYLNDKNFEFFVQSAQRYGFFIDRNAPWRLIANIGSSNMVPYMKKYNLSNTEDTFKKQFIKSYEYDLFYLRESYIRIYKKLVSEKPEYVDISPTRCGEEIKTFKRENLTIEEYYRANPLEKWLELYVFLRASSNKSKLNDEQLYLLQKKIKNISNSYGLEKAVFETNRIFNGYKNILLKKEYFTSKFEDVINLPPGEQEEKIIRFAP
jgi:hypothetical protein